MDSVSIKFIHVIIPAGEYRLCDIPRNALAHVHSMWLPGMVSTLLVSGAEFTRDMSTLLREAPDSRTAALPGSLKIISDGAFEGAARLVSAVLSEGLEKIREEAFSRCGLRQIVLPSTLACVERNAFHDCPGLKTVYVDDSSSINVGRYVRLSVAVLPAKRTLVAGELLWTLRTLREVVVPSGTTRIGRYWFAHSGVESVNIPASVVEIESYAFFRCKKLRSVAFAAGSELERLGERCFCESGLEEIALPAGLREISRDAFRSCGALRLVRVDAGCALDVRKYVKFSAEVVFGTGSAGE